MSELEVEVEADPRGAASSEATGRSSFLAAAGIFIARVGGLLRESAMGAILSTTIAADAFRAAVRIPTLLQNLMGEGVLSAAFIPVYSRLLAEVEDDDDHRADQVAGAVLGIIIVVSGGVLVLAVLFAGPITSLLAPGLTGETYDLTVRLVRIVTAGLGFLVISAWCLGILNSHRHFLLAYGSSFMWNAAQIVALLFVGLWGWSDADVAVALAWAVVLGGILEVGVQVPTIRRLAPAIRPSLQLAVPEVREVGRRFLPVVLARGVVQIGAYIDLLLASFLAVGALAALGYAQILYLLPVSLFALSVAAAELPELSRLDDDEVAEQLPRRVDVALRRITFFILFTVLAYLAAGNLIVAAIYQRGAFAVDDTTLVAVVLAAYSLGLLGIGPARLFQNTLYARGDVRGPAIIAVVRVVTAAALGAFFMLQLDQVVILDGAITGYAELDHLVLSPLPAAVRSNGDLPLHAGAVGLAFASAIASWLEWYLLRRRMHQQLGFVPATAGALRPLAVGGAIAFAMMFAMEELVTPTLPALLAMPVVVGAGGLVYVLVANAHGVTEAGSLVRQARSRLARLPGLSR